MCSGFSGFAVWSHNTILAQPGKAWLFSPDHSETSKYQNVFIWGWQKSLGYMISLFFSARQKDIENGSCKWSPCSKPWWVKLCMRKMWLDWLARAEYKSKLPRHWPPIPLEAQLHRTISSKRMPTNACHLNLGKEENCGIDKFCFGRSAKRHFAFPISRWSQGWHFLSVRPTLLSLSSESGRGPIHLNTSIF